MMQRNIFYLTEYIRLDEIVIYIVFFIRYDYAHGCTVYRYTGAIIDGVIFNQQSD